MNKKQRVTLGIGIGISVLCLVGVWFATGGGLKGGKAGIPPEADQQAAPGETAPDTGVEGPGASDSGMSFSPGDGELATYGYETVGEMKMDATAFMPDIGATGGGKQDKGARESGYKILAGGTLNLRFYAAGPGLWDVAAILTKPVLTINGEAPAYASTLDLPFVFRMNRRGLLSGFRFVRGTDESCRLYLENLILGMEILLPLRDESTWKTRERDEMGEYTATYTISTKEDGNPPEARIVKEKNAYVRNPDRATGGARQMLGAGTVKVTKATVDAAVMKGRAWFSVQEMDQELIQIFGGKREVQSTQRSRVWNIPGAEGFEFPATFAEFLALLDSPEYVQKALFATNPALDKLGAGLDVLQALAVYERLKKEGGSKGRLGDAFLVNYLKQYPDSAEDLASILATNKTDGGYDEDTYLSLWLILAEAGHAKAQAAILDVATNPEYDEKVRRTAMSYISDIEYPDAALVDRLWQLYESEAGGQGEKAPEGSLGDMGLLALGILGNEEKLNDAIKPAVGERLRVALADAVSTREQTIALSAIGNYGNESALTVVVPYMSSSDPLVRKGAFDALRRMNSGQAQQTLITAYGNEQSPGVKKVALETLARMPNLSEETMQWATSRVSKTGDTAEELGLIKVLGDSIQDHPQNENTLRSLMDQKPPREVMMGLLNYVEPDVQ